MRRQTRILDKDEAIAFIQNMRWFAGFGRITAKRLETGKYKVTASASAWSNWVSV